MPTRYVCNLSGICEPDELDEDRGYSSLEKCQEQCQGSTEKELDYLMYDYVLETEAEVRGIAPSDRVELIRRKTGVIVAPEDSYEILSVVGGIGKFQNPKRNIIALLKYHPLWDYLELFDEEGALDRILQVGTPEILRWLSDRPYKMGVDEWMLYLENSSYDEETRDLLFQQIRSQFPAGLEYPDLGPDALTALKYLVDQVNLNEQDEYTDRLKDWYTTLAAEYQAWRLEQGFDFDNFYA